MRRSPWYTPRSRSPRPWAPLPASAPATQSIQVEHNLPIFYCVTVKNVGIGPLTYHEVSDPLLGVTLNGGQYRWHRARR